MIDLTKPQLETVLSILEAYIPDFEVRVFGSRYHGTAAKYSDLDLVLVGEKKLDFAALSKIRDAFEESNLPFRVDVLDWNAITPNFQKIIADGYETIKRANREP
jgi:predicted nucleotidyltransferase